MYLLKYRTMNKFFLHFWLLWILSIKGDSLETVVDKEPGKEVYNQTATINWYQKNRDDNLPKFPILRDLQPLSTNIIDAHEVLRKGLKQFLMFKETDLGTYLNFLVNKRIEPFVDEFGQEIRNYKKVLRFIWEQHNETLVQNYAINHFDKDKLDLCSVARFLSHQTSVQDRLTIMNRMSDALNYRCHPCTPYTPKQYYETTVPSTIDINLEGLSPEERLTLCKEPSDKDEVLANSSLPKNMFACGTPDLDVTHLSYDFSPCEYSFGDVNCDGVSIEEVQKIFRRTIIPILHSVTLAIRPETNLMIPDNVLDNKRAMEIEILHPWNYDGVKQSSSLQVDKNAFQSTKNYTKALKILNMNCSHLNLQFLKGFNQLTNLTLNNMLDIHICAKTLPVFPRSTTLNLHSRYSTLNFFPLLTNGLEVALFWGNEDYPDDTLHDENIDQTMDWLLQSSSNTLEELTIKQMRRLTRVPRQISSFKALRKLWLNENGISTIKPGALSFSAPVSSLNIFGNGISEIKPGAFQGNFKDAKVLFSSISGNDCDFCGYGRDYHFTLFEESVFETMLQQMSTGTGFIYASLPLIDCGEERICHLAWLLAYRTVLLEERFDNFAKCSNGTSLRELLYEGFNHCKVA